MGASPSSSSSLLISSFNVIGVESFLDEVMTIEEPLNLLASNGCCFDGLDCLFNDMFGPPVKELVGGGAVFDALDDTLALEDAFDEVFAVVVDEDEDDLELNKF